MELKDKIAEIVPEDDEFQADVDGTTCVLDRNDDGFFLNAHGGKNSAHIEFSPDLQILRADGELNGIDCKDVDAIREHFMHLIQQCVDLRWARRS
ncbi:hypothetical protein ACFL2V_18405 [Pseudomonadota bacterium]